MKWFTGSIGDAIQKSKREKRIFIVYVTGACHENVFTSIFSHFLAFTELGVEWLSGVLSAQAGSENGK